VDLSVGSSVVMKEQRWQRRACPTVETGDIQDHPGQHHQAAPASKPTTARVVVVAGELIEVPLTIVW